MSADKGGHSAVQQAYDALLAFIEVAPEGSHLPAERGLATSLAVSRTTLRTAVDRLVRLGYLEVRHGAGIVVRRPSTAVLGGAFKDILMRVDAGADELMELRRVLEPRLAALAARRRDPAEIESLRASAISDPAAFYVGVARASGNRLAAELVSFLVSLTPAVPDVVTATSQTENEMWRGQRTAVVAAIAAGEAGAARDSLLAHLRALERAVLPGSR